MMTAITIYLISLSLNKDIQVNNSGFYIFLAMLQDMALLFLILKLGFSL